MNTELLIHGVSTKRWQVIERPKNDDRPALSQIKTLYTTTSKALAVAWAEGRQSVTGQPIRFPS